MRPVAMFPLVWLLFGFPRGGEGAQDSAIKSPPLPEKIEFNRDIRPILADTCFKCHGQDPKNRKAGLRLDTQEGATAPAESGHRALVPGNPGQSELWSRITTLDSDDRMPPAKTGKKLSRVQVELIRRWIEAGAPWQPHWSFVPLACPPAPVARNPVWGRSPLDLYILARLDRESLTPSPEADRPTLARRSALDLTGLPPGAEEVAAFVKDPSPDAYEKWVDHLLESPRYGEHMARYWLDLARYGDTHGLHLDNYREIWPYRDWVIRSFNENLPFDHFVLKQLAGDLLSEASLDDQVATGFLRCHVTTSEGGSIDEEVYCRNVFDRVETLGQTFFALTFTCSRCHDHKFDPVTQKDYYGLFAFFNSLDGPALDGNRKDTPPTVKVPSPEQARDLAHLREEAQKVEARLTGPLPELDAKQMQWESEMARRLAAQWVPLEFDGFKVTEGSSLRKAPDQSVQAGDPKLEYEVTSRVAAEGIQALLLEVLPPFPEVPGDAPIAFSLGEVEAELVPALDATKAEKIPFLSAQLFATADDPSVRNLIDGKHGTFWSGDARKRPGVVLVPANPFGLKQGGDLRLRLVHDGAQAKQPVPRFRISISTDAELIKGVTPASRGPWHLLGRFPEPDGDAAFRTEHGPERGVDLTKPIGELRWEKREDYVDGKDLPYPPGIGASYAFRTLQSPTARKVTFSISSDDAIQVWLNGAVVLARNVKRTFRKYDANKVTVDLDPGENRLLVKFSNYGTSRDHKFYFEVQEEEANDLHRDWAQALSASPQARSDAQKSALREGFRRGHWAEWAPLRRELANLRGRETAFLDQVPGSLVFRERPAPRDSFILKRGEYDKKADKVGRASPAALPPMAKELPLNRLGLAKWILDPANPLTARVTVNRFWQQVFGTGLVKTSEDFGLQGEPPSHPELLDYLASQFVADRWDVRKFMKRLVLSSAYRQSSKMTPELVRRDPDNRLLARGPRFRLDAEMMRDQILFLSGLLVERLGGPSFKAPQPEGLWEAVGYTGSNTYRFQRDVGPEKVFRRSLYIFWKRTSSPPQMTVFDAPSRESCVARRERTNTPLQALLLMNEPQCFEAARHLAQKTIREGGPTPEERARWLLGRCTLRNPTSEEAAVLAGAYRAQLEVYSKDPASAQKAVTFGDLPPDPAIPAPELAAWTLVANLVLNLDEVLNKR